jgi:hypothetical protein
MVKIKVVDINELFVLCYVKILSIIGYSDTVNKVCFEINVM